MDKAIHDSEYSNAKSLRYIHFYTTLLKYLFGKYEQATMTSKMNKFASDYPYGALDAAFIVLVDGLVAVQNARMSKNRRMLRSAMRH